MSYGWIKCVADEPVSIWEPQGTAVDQYDSDELKWGFRKPDAQPLVDWVMLIAHEANSGDIYYGGSWVDDSTASRLGFPPLDAGEVAIIEAGPDEKLDLSTLCVRCTTEDDSVRWVAGQGRLRQSIIGEVFENPGSGF